VDETSRATSNQLDEGILGTFVLLDVATAATLDEANMLRQGAS
jgi:hypothetical protein